MTMKSASISTAPPGEPAKTMDEGYRATKIEDLVLAKELASADLEAWPVDDEPEQ
jgi:hypothetical protein